MNYGINLLEDKNKAKGGSSSSRLKALRFVAIGLLFIVSAASIILFLLIALSPLPALQRQENTSRQTLSQFHTDIVKLAVVNERSDSIASIIGTRPSYDQILSLLKSKAPDGVAITSFKFEEKILTFTVSSKSIAKIDQFVNSLIDLSHQRKSFSDVFLTEFSMDHDKGLVLVTLTLTAL